MRAEIIAVGSELLSFSRPETNSLFLASQLANLGISIARKVVVGDREGDLIEAFRSALTRAEIVILSGGLGPTNDDITREVVAATLERPLREDASILEQLERRYSRFGLRMTANNRKQASVPEDAEVLPNPHGTAPGLFLQEGEVLIFLLPGPPRELCPMVENYVLPVIRQRKQTFPVAMRRLKVAGEAESRVDSSIESIYRSYADIETTILSSPGIISLYFVWKSAPSPHAAAELDELVGRVSRALGDSVFTYAEETLSQVLGRLLRERSLRLGLAESCTGGLVAKLITDVAGSSDYFVGGIVAYSNETKMRVLGATAESLDRFGAVSAEVASEMAAGARRILQAEIGLSVTGIAGPGGGTEEKPVGTVFLGLATSGGVKTRELSLPGSRESIRMRTSNIALDWLRRELL